jgi:hypothetical protein
MELKYYVQQNIGKAKYMVSYYTGKKHADGSDFYDVQIFKNKIAKERFIGLLEAQKHIVETF